MSPDCEMPLSNTSSDEISAILSTAKVIAVVGLSATEERDSHRVAKFLIARGYTVYGANPAQSEVLGRPCFPDLKSVPEPIDIVDIFRKPEAIPAIVDQAIALGAACVWMQQGLAHNAAAEKARAAGLAVVMNKCLKIEIERRALPSPYAPAASSRRQR